MDRVSVMDDQELKALAREALLDRQIARVRVHALDPEYPGRYDAVRVALQAILQPSGPQEKVRDIAEERRLEMEAFYRSIGIASSVPKPAVSNREFDRRRKAGQELFFRFATTDVSYEAFMDACGQGNHWTVTNADARAKIGWEPCEQGYWFWAEVNPSCPRLSTSWNDLSTAICLLSLEEYVIVWHERKSKGIVLDVPTWCWLRTRWDVSGALHAFEVEGGVSVNGCGAGRLSGSSDGRGGRAQEVVTTAA